LSSNYTSFRPGADSSGLVLGGATSLARWPTSFSPSDIEVALGDAEVALGDAKVALGDAEVAPGNTKHVGGFV